MMQSEHEAIHVAAFHCVVFAGTIGFTSSTLHAPAFDWLR